jgi:hypothetical protein
MGREWVRSSYCVEPLSICDTGTCVEVAQDPYWVHVRSSINPSRQIAFTPSEWVAFIAGVKDGEFDL